MDHVDYASIERLRELAQNAIVRLTALPQPVVRICGPLTSGGKGYDENFARFAAATRILTEKGYTVFDYFDHDDEEVIKALNLPWPVVMEHYHRPILETGLITTAFFLPEWQSSHGATWEHEMAEALNLEIREFPEEWFSN
jgi:hypothetical protein